MTVILGTSDGIDMQACIATLETSRVSLELEREVHRQRGQ